MQLWTLAFFCRTGPHRTRRQLCRAHTHTVHTCVHTHRAQLLEREVLYSSARAVSSECPIHRRLARGEGRDDPAPAAPAGSPHMRSAGGIGGPIGAGGLWRPETHCRDSAASSRALRCEDLAPHDLPGLLDWPAATAVGLDGPAHAAELAGPSIRRLGQLARQHRSCWPSRAACGPALGRAKSSPWRRPGVAHCGSDCCWQAHGGGGGLRGSLEDLPCRARGFTTAGSCRPGPNSRGALLVQVQ